MINMYPTGNKIEFSFKGTKFLIEETTSQNGVVIMYPFGVSKHSIKREILDKYANDVDTNDFFYKYILNNEKFLKNYAKDSPEEYYFTQKYLDDAFESYPDYLDIDLFNVDDLINPLKSVQIDALYSVYKHKLKNQIDRKISEL